MSPYLNQHPEQAKCQGEKFSVNVATLHNKAGSSDVKSDVQVYFCLRYLRLLSVRSMHPALLVLILTWTAFSTAEIYKWTDENGKVHFSDTPRGGIAEKSEKIEVKVNTYTSVTFEKLNAVDKQAGAVNQKVVMYSTQWCGYCKKARKYFRKNRIPFTEYDIEKNKKANKRYKKLGGTGVPVILYKDKRMNGFSEKSFLRIYMPSA